MTYLTNQITNSLKHARKRKGLSQRALSEKSGIPQSHISKIEKGAVDIRVSSLVALARVLDTELELVPRKLVPAIKSLIRTNELSSNGEYLNNSLSDSYLQDSSSLPAYRLEDSDDD